MYYLLYNNWMKIERIVSIKNPQLIRIRNNLRKLIREAYNERIIQDLNLRQKFPVGDSRWEELYSQEKKLKDRFKRSICICYKCNYNTKDMVYLPSSEMWICVDCNRKDKYIALLKDTLPLSKLEIRDFLNKLAELDWVRPAKNSSRSKDNDYINSKKVLDEMGISKKIQRHFLKLCICYGGYCDSEILMNAAALLLNEYTKW